MNRTNPRRRRRVAPKDKLEETVLEEQRSAKRTKRTRKVAGTHIRSEDQPEDKVYHFALSEKAANILRVHIARTNVGRTVSGDTTEILGQIQKELEDMLGVTAAGQRKKSGRTKKRQP